MDIHGGSLLIGVSAFRLYIVRLSTYHVVFIACIVRVLAIYLYRQCIATRCDCYTSDTQLLKRTY